MTLATAQTRRITIIQGEYHVTDDPNVYFTTILGSCVSACIRDPEARVGGLNHFLLPGDAERAASGKDSERYGVYLMELLINALMQKGARRGRLEAKLFGGARLIDGLTDVGSQNAAFGERFLKDEGIQYLGGSLRGDHARRIQFWPVSGRARQIRLENGGMSIFTQERVRKPAPPPESGGLELF